jgi:hypothetical protein
MMICIVVPGARSIPDDPGAGIRKYARPYAGTDYRQVA